MTMNCEDSWMAHDLQTFILPKQKYSLSKERNKYCPSCFCFLSFSSPKPSAYRCFSYLEVSDVRLSFRSLSKTFNIFDVFLRTTTCLITIYTTIAPFEAIRILRWPAWSRNFYFHQNYCIPSHQKC